MANSVIKSNRTAANTLTNGIKYERCGGLCIVTVENYYIGSTGVVDFATLPAGYRPGFTAEATFNINGSAIAPVWCQPDGLMSVYMNQAGNLSGTLIFAAAN